MDGGEHDATRLDGELGARVRPAGGLHWRLAQQIYRVELVIAGHLPDQRAANVLEHDEVAQQRQEAPLLEDALDQHLQLRVEGRRQLLTVEVRHGLNHSRPAESVPIRACMPSDTASTALPANNEGNSTL